jgi:hypothetical protein
MSIATARVHEIIALGEQPVLRNLLITDAYHRLAVAMAELLPGDLAWPGFATWASKQAGVFIRQEQLPAMARTLLDRLDVEQGRLARAMLDGTSRYIVNGNLTVFEELGLAFAGFVEVFAQPSNRTKDNLAGLLQRFRAGESMPDEVSIAADGTVQRKPMGGQGMIRDALRHYFEALHETDTDARAELLLLANVECGLHEQIRLQPYIAGALDAPVGEMLRVARIDEHPRAEMIVELTRQIATELLMTLPLPHEVLDLGSDLAAAPGSGIWPHELGRLDHPTLLGLSERVGAYESREHNLDFGDRAEGWFNTLLCKLDLARPEAQGTGAKNWAKLDDRMRFIFELFRSRQRDQMLLTPPFAAGPETELRSWS